MGGILQNIPYTHNTHVHCTLYRYVKALDRRAKVLRKLAGKLTGGDENLNLKIEYLRQALEVIFTLQKTFFQIFFSTWKISFIYFMDKTMEDGLFLQNTKLKLNSIHKSSLNSYIFWNTLYQCF